RCATSRAGRTARENVTNATKRPQTESTLLPLARSSAATACASLSITTAMVHTT
ncbi:hypothetical protein H0H81_011733, partial [Sphagnurus paluster]